MRPGPKPWQRFNVLVSDAEPWRTAASAQTRLSGRILGLRRESLEFRKFMNMLHPVEAFGRLYLHRRRK